MAWFQGAKDNPGSEIRLVQVVPKQLMAVAKAP
jgi:hypothetical protein